MDEAAARNEMQIKGLAIELSLVGGLGEDRRGDVWLVVLPITPLDDDFGFSAIPHAPEPGPEFEVSVTRGMGAPRRTAGLAGKAVAANYASLDIGAHVVSCFA
jgi:hypothetical protein